MSYVCLFSVHVDTEYLRAFVSLGNGVGDHIDPAGHFIGDCVPGVAVTVTVTHTYAYSCF